MAIRRLINRNSSNFTIEVSGFTWREASVDIAYTYSSSIRVRLYFKCGFAVVTASSALYTNKKTAAATLAGANAAITTEKAAGSRTRRAMSWWARSGPAAGGLVEVGGAVGTTCVCMQQAEEQVCPTSPRKQYHPQSPEDSGRPSDLGTTRPLAIRRQAA